jgi:hypothetical protein
MSEPRWPVVEVMMTMEPPASAQCSVTAAFTARIVPMMLT